MDNNCIFCKIIAGQIPCEKLYEDDNMIIIKDINPIAPIHYLLIIKEHYATLDKQDINQTNVLGQCLNKVSILKSTLGLEDGYRLVINQGKNGGQEVDHLHVHILGGKSLDWQKL